MKELDELRQTEMAELQKLREELAHPSHWIDDTERAIKEKLQPIIQQAEVGRKDRNKKKRVRGDLDFAAYSHI